MLLTLSFAGLDDGIVLCFGGDGHVAIEIVGPEGCTEVGETSDHPASALAIPVSLSHCGPCVDVALSASSATEAVKTAKPTSSAPAMIPTATLRPRVPYRGDWFVNPRTRVFFSDKPYTVVIRF
jgi:hypothetical protein